MDITDIISRYRERTMHPVTLDDQTLAYTLIWTFICKVTIPFIILVRAVVDTVTKEVRVDTGGSLQTAVEPWAGQVNDVFIVSQRTVQHCVVQ